MDRPRRGRPRQGHAAPPPAPPQAELPDVRLQYHRPSSSSVRASGRRWSPARASPSGRAAPRRRGRSRPGSRPGGWRSARGRACGRTEVRAGRGGGRARRRRSRRSDGRGMRGSKSRPRRVARGCRPRAWTASPAVPATTVRCAPCRAVGDGGADLDDRVAPASLARARPPASPGPPRWRAWPSAEARQPSARPGRCRLGADRVGGASSAPMRRRGRAQGRPADGAERVARSQPARPAGPPSRPAQPARPAGPIDPPGRDEAPAPAPPDAGCRRIRRQRRAPVAAKPGEDRHRRTQGLGGGPPPRSAKEAMKRGPARRARGILGRDLRERVAAPRPRRAPQEGGVGVDRVDRGDGGHGGGDAPALARCPRHGLEHPGDPRRRRRSPGRAACGRVDARVRRARRTSRSPRRSSRDLQFARGGDEDGDLAWTPQPPDALAADAHARLAQRGRGRAPRRGCHATPRGSRGSGSSARRPPRRGPRAGDGARRSMRLARGAEQAGHGRDGKAGLVRGRELEDLEDVASGASQAFGGLRGFSANPALGGRLRAGSTGLEGARDDGAETTGRETTSGGL